MITCPLFVVYVYLQHQLLIGGPLLSNKTNQSSKQIYSWILVRWNVHLFKYQEIPEWSKNDPQCHRMTPEWSKVTNNVIPDARGLYVLFLVWKIFSSIQIQTWKSGEPELLLHFSVQSQWRVTSYFCLAPFFYKICTYFRLRPNTFHKRVSSSDVEEKVFIQKRDFKIEDQERRMYRLLLGSVNIFLNILFVTSELTFQVLQDASI